MSQRCIPSLIPQSRVSKFNRLSSLDDTRYKAFLLRSLEIVAPCFDEDDASNRVDALYNMFRVQSRCDTELLYLIVRSHMLKQAMGCAVFQVDQRDTTGESHSLSEFESEGNSRSEAQSTGHTSQFSDLIGEQRYNDFADTVLRAETERTAFSWSHDESHTRSTDFGSGESMSSTDGTRMSESERVSHDESESDGNSRSDGAGRGCNYQMSQSRRDGSALNVLVAGYSRTGQKNTWDHIMRNDTTSSSNASRVGRSRRALQAESESLSQSLRVSSSYFNALVDERSWGFSQSQAEDHSRAQSDQVSHAEGLGQSNTEGKAKAQQSTQASSNSESLFESKRRGNSSSFSITDEIKLGQIFENLLQLYNNTLELIKYKKSRLVSNGYAIGEILTCREDGFIPYDFADATERKFCCPIPPASNLTGDYRGDLNSRVVSF